MEKDKKKCCRFCVFLRDFFSLCRILFVSLWQALRGTWKLSELPYPRVTFFGGAHLQEDDYYFQQAKKLAFLCGQNNISVLTGAGPGIMEAASCGVMMDNDENLSVDTHDASNVKIKYAKKQAPKTLGIGLFGMEDPNRYVLDNHIQMRYLFIRKMLLIEYSQCYIFFPGGFGTLDELGEVLMLMNTNMLKKRPIILFDQAFWGQFLNWIGSMLKNHYIVQKDLELITVINSIDEIMVIIKKVCLEQKCL